ncbi:MAG: branched-chain amino acid ABC transporter permease [Candidatus Rokuibacteriota bacterium]|nr:MAG: branched-chain amino acid ABC transporter permease [Candidatus Rokubacteria bacterium]
MGNLPRRRRLRSGALVRDPLLPALLDLRGLRPHGGGAHHPPLGPPGAASPVSVRGLAGLAVFVAALLVPALGSRFYTFLANDVIIWALFATSLNLLVGYTGLVSFGHAAYFGVGAYVTGILMKKLAVPFVLAWPAAGVVGAACALVFGFFCVRLTRIYFAMLTLAFAQIVWAICFKWNELTGGEQGMPEIPYPDFGWIERIGASVPLLGGWRTAEYFYFLCTVLVAASLWALHRIVTSPFGRMLTTIRENAERAEFIGVNVQRYELAAFVLAGTFAGLAGGLFGIFNRGVFPDFAYWTKSSEVLIMTLLGGMGTFFGPSIGALVLILLNQQIVSYTEYWPLVLGTVLVVLLFGFPGGLAGAVGALSGRLLRRVRSA